MADLKLLIDLSSKTEIDNYLGTVSANIFKSDLQDTIQQAYDSGRRLDLKRNKIKSIFWMQNSYGEERTVCYCGEVFIGHINMETKLAYPLYGKHAHQSVVFTDDNDARKFIEEMFTEWIGQFIEGE